MASLAASEMNRLLEIGFQAAGHWQLIGDELSFELSADSSESPREATSAHATTARAATRSATSDATCAKRTGSPAAIGATLTPTRSEIADVGPTARCREEPSAAYPRPPSR